MMTLLELEAVRARFEELIAQLKLPLSIEKTELGYYLWDETSRAWVLFRRGYLLGKESQ